MQNKNLKLTKNERIYLIFLFIFYFAWAVVKPLDYAPDEAMRYAVTEFLYLNNRLPVGAELLNDKWGFSYAHLPTVLCNLLGFVFMKFVGLFTQNPFALLVAARMVSVCCGVGVIYFVFKIAKQLFSSPTHWIMVIFISMIPQYAFLSSYINNDIVALLGASIILYCWVTVLKNSWEIKNVVILAIGISICALSYYNSYGWILCSIFFFIGSYLLQNENDYKGVLKYGVLISGVVLFLIGPIFMRHAILYDDLLGMNTTVHYGELYAIDSYKPSNRLTLFQQGKTLSYMLFDMGWLDSSYMSFVGIFGYMDILITPYVYTLYKILFLFSMLGVAYFLVKENVRKFDMVYRLFSICLLFSMVIPIILSIYYSFFNDFQAQGRYCYAMILGLALFVTTGLNQLFSSINKRIKKRNLILMYAVIFILVNVSEFLITYLPS